MTNSTTLIKPNLGLTDKAHTAAVELLQTLLADEAVLYQKLRKYHWNVTGAQFKGLHELFEEQYKVLAIRIDAIAERIRTYGAYANGTFKEFLDTARLEEQPDDNPNARTMINQLVDDHETLVRELHADIETADSNKDSGLADFLTVASQMHQDMGWMLRAYLEGSDV